MYATYMIQLIKTGVKIIMLYIISIVYLITWIMCVFKLNVSLLNTFICYKDLKPLSTKLLQN